MIKYWQSLLQFNRRKVEKRMAIELVMQPGITVSAEKFMREAPPYSVALDGYVREVRSMFITEEPKAILDHHHSGSLSIDTQSTCKQVYEAIETGFFDLFVVDGEPNAILHLNDCDQDVTTAVFLLEHMYPSKGRYNDDLDSLVRVEDIIDRKAGAYPRYPREKELLEYMAWVFDPYWQNKLSGELDRGDPEVYIQVLNQCMKRLTTFTLGNANRQKLNTEYEIIRDCKSFKVVRETGAQARMQMYADGIRAYISVRERQDGKNSVVIGKMSECVPCSLEKVAKKLNQLEQERLGISELERTWGGRGNVIASPRVVGTVLRIEDFVEIFREKEAESKPKELLLKSQ